ncbi:MAG: tetratricopeptide repeat protein [Planctomycetes bacterium]|nr:tetratricopeptide repeat protein [Planctomycetota bacterium]
MAINDIDDIESGIEKALAFFDRGEQVADTDNFDYAIEMYIEGLRRSPDNLESGHIALRKISLIRQGKGGKKASIKEKMKFSGGKTPIDKMLNAEFLLAKDPDHLPYAETMLSAAVAGGYARTAEWIAKLVFEANIASDKPSIATYVLLKESYSELQLFSEAVNACRQAVKMRPDNAVLQDELRDLSAQMTMQKGKYGQEGDFTNSIRDKDKQRKLYEQKRGVKTIDFRVKALDDAKKAVIADPNSQVKVLKLAETLFDTNTRPGCEQAVKALRDAFARSGDFIFKKRGGEYVIKRLNLEAREARSACKADLENQELKKAFAIAVNKENKAKLQHYKICAAQYPTDLVLKYEYALCLIKDKKYDEAIPLLQDAQKDPRKKLSAMDETGLCFFLKGWYADAIDIFTQAIEACDVKDSKIAKDLRYNLARSYEKDGQTDKAFEMLRKLAQLDFGYKDVKERVDGLRNKK